MDTTFPARQNAAASIIPMSAAVTLQLAPRVQVCAVLSLSLMNLIENLY